MKEIVLSNGMKCLVDDSDFEYLNQFNWHYKTGYAHRNLKVNGKWTTRTVHRDILNPKWFKKVDHIDGNGLNNQRSNLRIATQAENSRNRRTVNATGYKGVNKAKGCNTKPYRATLRVEGKRHHLGYYTSPHDAARAYNEAAYIYFGEFAKLNNTGGRL